MTRMNRRTVTVIILCTLAGMATGLATAYAWLGVGACSGIIQMCTTAPEWWEFTWTAFLFVIPVAVALISGRWLYRKWC